MWSDNETADDLLGFRVHADLVRELIMDPSVLPVTIGVYGDWGGGKSSIMQMLQADFEKKCLEGDELERYKGVAVLYFNGWLFEGYDDAKAALLSSILTALRDHKRFGPKIKEYAVKLLKRVAYMRGARMLFTGAIAGGVAASTGGLGLAALVPAFASGALAGAIGSGGEAAKAAAEGVGESSANEDLSDIRQFRDEFAKMIEKSDIKTLVVLIDDLDRCSPDRIIENLEAIKLFLNVPNTAFVIGADRRIIRQAVAWRYRESLKTAILQEGQSDPSDRLVDDYLEKLIQIPYRLPRLSPSEIESYLTLLFCKRHLEPDIYAKICDLARLKRNKDRYRSFSQTDVLEFFKCGNIPASLSAALSIGSGISSQITDVLQGNPRQVKRFLNAFILRKKLADVAGLADVKDDVLVKLMLLEYAVPKLFDRLFAGMSGETGIVGFFDELEVRHEKRAAISQSQPADAADGLAEWDQMRKWITMSPQLRSLDLRDYMWVTRDRLGSTMSGTTMIPPVVRTTMKQMLGEMSQKQGYAVIPSLSPHERTVLVQQLTHHAQRAPGEVKAFQAIAQIAMVDEQFCDAFGELISRIRKADLSPALGVYIQMLAKQTTKIGATCKSIMSELSEDKSDFGRTFRQKAK